MVFIKDELKLRVKKRERDGKLSSHKKEVLAPSQY